MNKLAQKFAARIRGAAISSSMLPWVGFSEQFDEKKPTLELKDNQEDKKVLQDFFARHPATKEGRLSLISFNVAGVGHFNLSFYELETAGQDLVSERGVFQRQPIRGKTVLLIGAAQGIGQALAGYLAADHARLILADINYEKVSSVAQQLTSQGYSALALPVNVAASDSVQEFALQVARRCGAFDLLLISAAAIRSGPTLEMKESDFDLCAQVNYRGYFLLVKYLTHLLVAQAEFADQHFSDVIQLNSKSGLEGSYRNAAYAGSKFGGIGLSQSFALEFISSRIKFNSICPGNYLDGPLWSDPEKGLLKKYLEAGKVPGAQNLEDVRNFYMSKVPCARGCQPEDILQAVYYLVAQKYETGQALPVSGGQVMLS